MYYRNAQAAIVMYDITKSSTLDKAKGWVKELQRQANSQIVIALVGNKLDLVEGGNEQQDDDEQDDNSTSRQVTYEEASAYASEAGLLFLRPVLELLQMWMKYSLRLPKISLTIILQTIEMDHELPEQMAIMQDLTFCVKLVPMDRMLVDVPVKLYKLSP
ncbi:unnamed protein product [Mucor circinelloides]